MMNKVAVVTGALGGIGQAICEILEEMNFIVHGLDIKRGFDITNIDNINNYLITECSTINVLVNCAGITKGDNILEVNLKAPYKLSELVFPYMKKNGGNIINITSLWSEKGFKGNPYYGMSKGGLKMLTKCLAVEYAPYNIRVNNIGLGYFQTKMTSYSWNNRREEVTSKIPLGRWGKPEDIKPAIKFLLESEYITGTSVYLDGGWLASGGLK